jgi:FAD/FMN-containing dehydrogenase
MRIRCMAAACSESVASAMESIQIESLVSSSPRPDAGAMTTTTASLTSLPGSPECDLGRRAWNLTADQRPAAVCVATRVEHVQAALAYARTDGLHLAAQATGHFAQGLPPLDRTLLLKLALHEDEEIAVDPVARTARVPAGARWIDVVEAVAPRASPRCTARRRPSA